MKAQVTIEQLKRIIEAAERAKKHDSSLSETLEIEVTNECKTHLGGDMIGVSIKSNYSECYNTSIYLDRE